MSALKQICEVLGLQRKNLERDIAVLDGKIASVERDISEMLAEKQKITEGVFSGGGENIAQDYSALELWNKGFLIRLEELKARRAELQQARIPKIEELTAVIVKDDMLQKKLELELKAQREQDAETQTSERLETWINANIS